MFKYLSEYSIIKGALVHKTWMVSYTRVRRPFRWGEEAEDGETV